MTAAAPFTSEIRDGRKRQAHKGNGGDSETRSTEQNKLLNIEALST